MKKLSLILVLALAGTACKKSDEKKPAATETAPTEAAKAEEAKPAEAAKPTEAAAPAGTAEIKDAADYEAKGLELVDGMANAFASAGEDCDKAAANITAFLADKGGTFEAIKKFEDGNPDAKKAVEEKMKGKSEELMGKIMPVAMKCKDHEGLRAAMEKLPQ